MTLQELQSQVLQLPIGDRWRLVQSLLNSIQQETLIKSDTASPDMSFLAELDPWTQGLVGVIRLDNTEDPTESYVDYLEEKHS
ncbi:MAG: hypothetical protein WBA10_21730 [Elainellaceae cyanobacterium]